MLPTSNDTSGSRARPDPTKPTLSWKHQQVEQRFRPKFDRAMMKMREAWLLFADYYTSVDQAMIRSERPTSMLRLYAAFASVMEEHAAKWMAEVNTRAEPTEILVRPHVEPTLLANLGATIKAMRLARGLTQKQLAKLADAGLDHISKVESGTRQLSTLPDLFRLSSVLGYDMNISFAESKRFPFRWPRGFKKTRKGATAAVAQARMDNAQAEAHAQVQAALRANKTPVTPPEGT